MVHSFLSKLAIFLYNAFVTETLLRTKLYIPPPRPNLILRPRLIEQLNQALRLRHRLTLISAPAGFGKTTMTGAWVEALDRPAAWLSLDEGDSEPTRFLAYLVAALQTAVPAFGEETAAVLQSPQASLNEALLTTLLNEITAVPEEFVLVLDDYHLVDTRPVDQALDFLLEHLPPQLHVVIITREDPHLPLARLRARGQLSEIRAADLRFTSSEAAEFLKRTMGLDLAEEDIIALEARTEGWIAGLQLAAISMRGRDDAAALIKSFTGSHRLVLDYLIEEVLLQQDEDIQTFLLQTAVLERLNGSLCDALTGGDDGQKTLEELERANLFLVPLDNERCWYRYHHLFASLLRQRLRQSQPELVPILHSRGSTWYEQNDQPSDAIRHALAAADFERAAALAELTWPAMSGSYQSIAWLGWLKTLPDAVVRARPVLSASYAWAFLNAGDLEAADERLRDVERWLEAANEGGKHLQETAAGMFIVDKEQFQALPVSLAAARAYHAQATGDLQATKKYARRVLDLIPEGPSPWRTDVTALLGLVNWASGDLEAAYETFADGLLGMDELDFIVGTFVLADIKMALGQLHEALSLCRRALRLADEHGQPIGTEDIYSQISKIHREQGDLQAAAEDLRTARKLGEQVELPDWQYRWCIAQARLRESVGELDNALDLLDEAQRVYVRTPLPDVRPVTAAKARIWLKQGNLAEALGWVREQKLTVTGEDSATCTSLNNSPWPGCSSPNFSRGVSSDTSTKQRRCSSACCRQQKKAREWAV